MATASFPFPAVTALINATVERLRGTLDAGGVKIFATPLMQASPSVALDLPLKAPAGDHAVNKVWLTHSSADYIRQRHGLTPDMGRIAR